MSASTMATTVDMDPASPQQDQAPRDAVVSPIQTLPEVKTEPWSSVEDQQSSHTRVPSTLVETQKELDTPDPRRDVMPAQLATGDMEVGDRTAGMIGAVFGGWLFVCILGLTADGGMGAVAMTVGTAVAIGLLMATILRPILSRDGDEEDDAVSNRRTERHSS